MKITRSRKILVLSIKELLVRGIKALATKLRNPAGLGSPSSRQLIPSSETFGEGKKQIIPGGYSGNITNATTNQRMYNIFSKPTNLVDWTTWHFVSDASSSQQLYFIPPPCCCSLREHTDPVFVPTKSSTMVLRNASYSDVPS